MILKSFKFASSGWSLDKLTLGQTNLIVGKNSTGKTRSLDSLLTVKRILDQTLEINDLKPLDSELILSHNGDEIKFAFATSGKQIVREVLNINGKDIISRDGAHAEINGETVNPPADKLMIHVRRDTTKYPIIEDIIGWAEKMIVRSFIDTDSPSNEELFNIVAQFSDDMKQHIVSMANEVGFPLTMIDTFENAFGIDAEKINPANLEIFKYIMFQEQGIPHLLLFDELSNGMQRTILLFIFIELLINSSIPALVAIDDLGEGLDFIRATKVGKKLFETCQKADVQLIATSNEEFMMNIVDINHWNVLVRDGQTVRSITSSSAPEIFEDFSYSGLSNFDFFTSDIFQSIQ